jgi:DNA-binding NarL/FixJ family response regulator
MNEITLVLVDDAPEVRGVIKALLRRDQSFRVIGEAGDGAEGVRLVGELQPDLVLLDLAMPVMDGLTALPLILEAAPATQVVVLSAFGTDRTVQAAMNAGATAFIHKGGDLADELLPILKRVRIP